MYSPFSHPDKAIARGSIILTSLLVLTTGTAYATVDTAVRSGEVQNYVIEPTIKAYNSFVEDFANQLVEDQKAKEAHYQYEIPDSATTQNKVEINITNTSTTSGSTTRTTTTQQKVISTPRPSATNYPSSLKTDWEQDAAARQAQQKAEYDAAVKQMNEDYNARVQQNQQDSQKAYDEAVAKQKADFEAQKAEMGF